MYYVYTHIRWKFLMGFIFLGVSADYGLVLVFGGKTEKQNNESISYEKKRIKIERNKKRDSL